MQGIGLELWHTRHSQGSILCPDPCTSLPESQASRPQGPLGQPEIDLHFLGTTKCTLWTKVGLEAFWFLGLGWFCFLCSGYHLLAEGFWEIELVWFGLVSLFLLFLNKRVLTWEVSHLFHLRVPWERFFLIGEPTAISQ